MTTKLHRIVTAPAGTSDQNPYYDSPVPLNAGVRGNFALSFAVVTQGGTDGLPAQNPGPTWTMQHTLSNVFEANGGQIPANWTWFDNANYLGVVGNSDGNYEYPVTAVRLKLTSPGKAMFHLISET